MDTIKFTRKINIQKRLYLVRAEQKKTCYLLSIQEKKSRTCIHTSASLISSIIHTDIHTKRRMYRIFILINSSRMRSSVIHDYPSRGKRKNDGKKIIWQKAVEGRARRAGARNTRFDVFVFYAHILIIGSNRSRCYGRGMRHRFTRAQTRQLYLQRDFVQVYFNKYRWRLK